MLMLSSCLHAFYVSAPQTRLYETFKRQTRYWQGSPKLHPHNFAPRQVHPRQVHTRHKITPVTTSPPHKFTFVRFEIYAKVTRWPELLYVPPLNKWRLAIITCPAGYKSRRGRITFDITSLQPTVSRRERPLFYVCIIPFSRLRDTKQGVW